MMEGRLLVRARRWPLRLKIILLLLVSCVVPLAIMGTFGFDHARRSVLKTTTALLTARSEEVGDRLDALHIHYRGIAGRVAALPEMLRYLESPATSRKDAAPAVLSIFRIWLASDANIRGLGILDATGNVAFASEPALMSRDLAHYRYVREAMDGVQTISDLYVSGPETGSVASVAYVAPVKSSDGKIAGFAVLWIRAKALWSVLRDVNEKAGPGSFSVLFDQFGVRIGHSYDPEIVFHSGDRLDAATINAMVAERRFGDRTRELLESPRVFPRQFELARSSAPGREPFRGFAPVNEQWNLGVPRRLVTVPWTLFYMIPEESLDAPIAGLMTRTILLTTAAIVLALVAGVLVSRGIVKSARLVSEAAESLGACAGELTATVSQMASSTSESASAVSQTTATVGEVKQTAEVSNQKAKHVSESAQKATQVAQTGRKAVEGSLEGMKRIQEQMESIAQSVVRLSEQGQAIGEIIATVNDLAEQSNLLAVNASIEAAKAGEQGKGFGVVAQEVKSLAEQSKQATAQVRALLNDIQKATTAAVLASEQGSKAVEAGVQQATHAGEAIRQLGESITEAAQAATQIAASSQQQLVGTDQVALAMENIRQASAQNVAGTKQAEVAAHNLHELGQKLNRVVQQYGV